MPSIYFKKTPDADWLQACRHRLVWQGAKATLERLSLGTESWDAYLVARDGRAVGAEAGPTLPHNTPADGWCDNPVGTIEDTEQLVLVYDTESIILRLLAPSRAPLGEFFNLALAMVRRLAAAHADGASLGFLHPSDFAMDRDKTIKLRVRPSVIPAQALGLVDEFIYRAPEQLRPVAPQYDNRSDLYALGMILFRYLTGIFPLAANSPVEWRHAHLALAPMEASSLFADLPPMIGRILSRLLAKEPAARYQTALSLEFDLARCEREWCENGSIPDFEIGRVDTPLAHLWTSALFGREEEEQAIGALLGRFLDHGEPSMISVHGQPGIGKSSLIHGLLNGVDGKALVIWGKSDQNQSEVPYGPVLQAISALIDEAVRTDPAKLAALREALPQELLGNAPLLVDLVPAMEILTGPQISRIEAPGPMVQLRIQRALRTVLSVAAATIGPLLLFLDDVQWSDDATRSFLSMLSLEPVLGVLLIVVRRDQPVEVRAWSERLVEDARVTMTELAELYLGPLTLQATHQMLETIFPDAPEGLAGLAGAIYEKTGGNPFYLRRLLQALVQDGVVYFSQTRKAWLCRAEDIAGYPASENVVSFITARIEKEGRDALRLLQTMACIGPQSDKEILASALGWTAEELEELGTRLARSGFVLASPAKLSFAHDRIQEAAYSLMDEPTRQRRHFDLADVMMALWGSDINAAAFAIANQIELCGAEHLPIERRKAFADALLLALQHARGAAAFGQAVRYGEVAVRLVQDDLWDADYDTSFGAHKLLCEALLGAASLEAAETRLDALLRYARSALDRSVVFRLRANLLTLKSDYDGAIDHSLLGLEELGIKLARGSSEEEQDQAYRAIRQRLNGRSIAELEHLPVMEDPKIKAAMSLLAPLISSVFTTDGLRFLHLAKMVELTLEYGVCPESTYGLGWFGVIIADKYGAYHDGLCFGLAARALVDRQGFEHLRTSVLVGIDQIAPWTKPMSYALEVVRGAIHAAHTSGDVGWVCYARNHLLSDLIVMGEELTTIRQEAEEAIAIVRRFGYADIEHILAAQLRLVEHLAVGISDPASRSGPLTIFPPIVSPPTTFWVTYYDGLLLYFSGFYEAAVEKLASADALIPLILAHIDTAYCRFFLGLAIAARGGDLSFGSADRTRLEELRNCFAAWAELNPLTFSNKFLLLDAEIARLDGEYAKALGLYEKAAMAARSSRFEHENALALERASVCCVEMGHRISATSYLTLAAGAYERWGAMAKAKTLLASQAADSIRLSAPTFGLASANGELETVFGASMALSEEIALDRLIETLMTRMLIHAGANRGLLLKIGNGKLEAEASAWTEGDSVRISTIDPDRYGLAPPYSVIDRALQTRAPFVISGSDFEVASDRMPVTGRSMLCVPLLRRGELTGLLCLQNDYLEGVFETHTVALLTFLASQAAISLENARLYTRLLQENELRARSEQALAGARAELEKNARLTLLGGIAASVTHELGQPLSAIASNAGAGRRWLNRAEPNLAETLSVLTEIESSVTRAHEIIRALRALSKQAPKVEELVDLKQIILEVLRIAQSEIECHGTEIVLDLSTAEATVLGDATQLKQVVLNLLNNGMEAMKDLPAPQRRIEMVSKRICNEVVVTVRDFGIGIPPAIASQIFEPMFTTKDSGMGMGLAICKSIIDAHQGVLSVAGQAVGTKFTFSLPLIRHTSPSDKH